MYSIELYEKRKTTCSWLGLAWAPHPQSAPSTAINHHHHQKINLRKNHISSHPFNYNIKLKKSSKICVYIYINYIALPINTNYHWTSVVALQCKFYFMKSLCTLFFTYEYKMDAILWCWYFRRFLGDYYYSIDFFAGRVTVEYCGSLFQWTKHPIFLVTCDDVDIRMKSRFAKRTCGSSQVVCEIYTWVTTMGILSNMVGVTYYVHGCIVMCCACSAWPNCFRDILSKH